MVVRPIATKTPAETRKLAGRILKVLRREPAIQGAAVIGFSGELGSGKTTLIQGIGQALGMKGEIQSPTFVLMRRYPLPRNKRMPWENLVHIDVYRLDKKREIVRLGLKNIFKNPENLVLIEWAEKIKYILPRRTLWVELRHTGMNHRHIVIKK